MRRQKGLKDRQTEYNITMVYIDLRYTPPADTTINPKIIVLRILEFFEELNDAKQHFLDDLFRTKMKYLVASEEYNKFGEKTHLHFHINMECTTEHPLIKPYRKDAIAKQLNRKLGLKGNAMYCLRVHENPENIERWWRYTCKQGIPFSSSPDFKEEEKEEMHKIAKAEYEQRVVENQATRDKIQNKNNFRQKLAKHLHEKLDSMTKRNYQVSDKQLWLAIAEYYRDSHTTPPFMKMDDLVIDMKVELKYITLEEYYDLKH